MGNTFYDGDREVQNPKQRKYLASKRDKRLFTHRNILMGIHKRRKCVHLDPLSSEKCVCAPIISKIILDNPTESKRKLAETYAFDELGNYIYCCNTLIKCGFNNHMLQQMRELVRLKASRDAPDGYRMASFKLIQKYKLYDYIVHSNDVIGYFEMSTSSHLLKIPDPFTHSQ
jgi:hypothetical protein